MEELKNWGLLLLFLSAGSLVYCFLLPSGAVSKTSKSVISIVLMSFVFMPLFSVFGNSVAEDFELSGEYETRDYNSYIEESAKAVTEELIRSTVRKFTNVPYKTEIFINKSTSGDINIEYVGIVFAAPPQFEKEMTEALFDTLGIIPHIKVELTDE